MKYYITTPIYYVNDKPHIGSAYTTIAADILARLHRFSGDDVFFLAGVAEHGSKIAESAEKAGKDPQQFVDEITPKFQKAWESLEISNDDFIRTTEKRHTDAVVLFFNKLKDSGKIYEADYNGMYCVGHEAFLTESELVDGICPLHKTKPEIVKERNWFFKLSEYGPILKKKIEEGELKIEPAERRNEVLSFIDQGLEDITISRRTAKFALSLPWDDSQTIYVWLDELFNYCSAIGYGADKEKFKQYWPADVHLIGKDIIRFHAIIWPALLLAIGEKVPHEVFAHGFFTVNGQKMSKTLGNVIDPMELAIKYGSDAVRYFLMREIAFGQDGDVSEEKIKARYDGDLANGLGNLVSRLTNMIEKYSHGEIPDIVEPKDKLDGVVEMIEGFRFHEALARIWEAIAWANQYIDETKPWDLAKDDASKEKLDAVLSVLGAEVKLIGLSIAPFMPQTAEKIRKAFESDAITKIEPLFPRIE